MTLHTKNHPISTIKKSSLCQALTKALYPPQSLLIHGGLNPSSPALTNPLIISVVAGGRITTARNSINRPQFRQHHPATPNTLHSSCDQGTCLEIAEAFSFRTSFRCFFGFSYRYLGNISFRYFAFGPNTP